MEEGLNDFTNSDTELAYLALFLYREWPKKSQKFIQSNLEGF